MPSTVLSSNISFQYSTLLSNPYLNTNRVLLRYVTQFPFLTSSNEGVFKLCPSEPVCSLDVPQKLP